VCCTAEDISNVREICENTWTNHVSVNDCSLFEHSSLTKVSTLLTQIKNKLSNESRTARLWIQYMYYITLLKRFITAERTGNCQLHLSTTYDMLHLFAATGHYNYSKCSRLYLQMMQDMRYTHPSAYDQFVNHGFHSIRRSDRFWAGLSSDLIIEQIMMKSKKGRAGLTRGRGIHESVRLVWVKSMHECANIHVAMK